MNQLIQCVPNFSEGRKRETLDRLVWTVRRYTDVRLVDWSADDDHNRSVFTFVGSPQAVLLAAKACCEVAIDTIDMREQTGVHPRLGALDVLPIVPLRDIDLSECAQIAVTLAEELADLYDLPIFLYEASSPNANSQEFRSLPFVRKSAFHSLQPDFGPAQPHLTAGATVIGARNPLVAYNINLQTSDPKIAKRIAKELRNGGSLGFSGIRALGLKLESRNCTQVSMNITNPSQTNLYHLTETIFRRAKELGTTALGSEVIGALPGFVAFDSLMASLHSQQLNPDQILLENWPGLSA